MSLLKHQPPARTRNAWATSLLELERVVEELGRLPRERDATVPLRLLSWVKNQRRARHLTAEQIRLLEGLPGWSWAPRDDDWDERAILTVCFVAKHGRLPRIRSEDVCERALGHWVARQRRADASDALTPRRRDIWRRVVDKPAGHGPT